MIDHALFDPATIDPETLRLNAEIVAAHAALPDPWSLPIEEVRARRRAGTKAAPAMPHSARAEWLTIEGPAGPLKLRVIRPKAPAKLRSAYLHPAALLDCEAAALWLAGPGRAEFGIHALTIGGESVGAHLAVMVLLRLRDLHDQPRAFRGANLNAGFYDLGLTPSVRNWGDERLVVNTRDLTKFADGYVREGIDRRRPDVSPIYADLKGLPPALFTIGTADPLLDDTLYMSARWAAAGNGGHTAIYPGGCHVFARYPSAMSERALELIDRFLMALA
jgi:acetyl esterase